MLRPAAGSEPTGGTAESRFCRTRRARPRMPSASEALQPIEKNRCMRRRRRNLFLERPALGAADIDGWRGREHVRYLFQNNLKKDGGIRPLMCGSIWRRRETAFQYVQGKKFTSLVSAASVPANSFSSTLTEIPRSQVFANSTTWILLTRTLASLT